MADRIITGSAIMIGNSTIKGKLNKREIPPTPALNFIIVGPDNIEGDIRAGQYYILDKDTMKQVVASTNEVTDAYKEYLGDIRWNVNNNLATIDSNPGTEASISINNSGSFELKVIIGNEYAAKTIQANHYITDYYISSFADLQELQRVINNSTESTITLTKNPDSQYTPVNGNGLSGAHLRLSSNINCGGSHVEIGWYSDSSARTDISKYKAFRGIFDGAGYTISNIGGTIATNTISSSFKYGSWMFNLIDGGRVYNFGIEGSIVKNKWCSAFIVIARDCLVSRIYSDIYSDRTRANTATEWCVFAYATNNGAVLRDLYFANNFFASCVGGFAPVVSSTIERVISISSYYNQSGMTSYGFGLCQNTATFQNIMIHDFHTSNNSSTSTTQGSSLAVLFAWCNYNNNNRVMRDTYVVHTGGAVSSGSWVIRKGTTSIAPTIQNVFYDSQKGSFSHGSDEGATAKTTEQLKVGNVFANNSNWIEKQGFYPLINNQYAVNPDVLAAIRL